MLPTLFEPIASTFAYTLGNPYKTPTTNSSNKTTHAEAAGITVFSIVTAVAKPALNRSFDVQQRCHTKNSLTLLFRKKDDRAIKKMVVLLIAFVDTSSESESRAVTHVDTTASSTTAYR